MKHKSKKNYSPTEKRRRVLGIISILAFILAIVLIFIFAGKPIIDFVSNPKLIREWVASNSILSPLAFIGMMTLQIIIAIIPGEPLEIAAGYAFGFWGGTAVCMIGGLIGSAVVFMFVRQFGVKVVEIFFPREKIQSLPFMKNEKRLNSFLFLLYAIPGSPKDIMTYCVGLTKIKFSTWVILSTIARIPSIITSTIGGDALGVKNYQFAIIMFSATIVISIGGFLLYNAISKRKDKKQEMSNQ